MDLLLVAHHPLVGHHRNWYVLGTESDFVGLPSCLLAGSEGSVGSVDSAGVVSSVSSSSRCPTARPASVLGPAGLPSWLLCVCTPLTLGALVSPILRLLFCFSIHLLLDVSQVLDGSLEPG